jgi:hypothetical protein
MPLLEKPYACAERRIFLFSDGGKGSILHPDDFGHTVIKNFVARLPFSAKKLFCSKKGQMDRRVQFPARRENGL